MAVADFNKIAVNSSLTVVPAAFASLCFNDNLLIQKNKYTITDNILNLLVDTTDTVTIFSNNGIAATYEFEYIRLNKSGVVLPNIDINNHYVENLSQNKILVFVDGKLQPTNTYTVVDENTLKFNINYTNDYNKLFSVTIYTTTSSFQRTSYTAEQIHNSYEAASDEGKEAFKQNRLTLPVTYEYKNTALFIDEHKVPFNAIDVLNTESTEIQLNIPESILTDIHTLEIVKFTDNSTSSINFTTKQGYLTYGPYDDLGKKLTNTYNVIFKFNDQVKLLIDNIRTGFIIKEEDGYGEAIIVDTNFETMEMKGLIVQPFPYSNYSKNDYHLEVPEVTSILEYLAEFDKKYTFLPEILTIFQKILLNDINDTIERLREARSIGRVDSIHINKLIKLLGFDINIKQLNKKQRRELIEELTEFYRVAGTRQSYNLINILQNNLKLISADQLFTPAGLSKRKNQTLYSYNIDVAEGKAGSGYAVHDMLALESSGLIAEITEVNEDPNEGPIGAIKGVALETSEGYKEINDTFTMKSVLNGSFKANSTPNLYAYTWTATDPVNCEVGTILESAKKTYKIEVERMEGGAITALKPLVAPHKPYEDKTKVDFNKLQLYRLVDDFTADITSEPIYNSDNNYGSPIYVNTEGGSNISLALTPGTYYVEASGGGGAGAAADSKTGNEYDLPATDGSAGELKTGTFTLTETTTLKGKVGQGGGAVKARGHDSQPYNQVLGNGFHNGTLGGLLNLTVLVLKKHKASYGNIAGGQGGGSTGLTDANGNVLIEARGGNGGAATGRYDEHVNGGIGGGGGITSGNGAAGGRRALGGDFWSKAGSNGWIKIYRIPVKYDIKINGDLSTVADGETWKTVETTLSPDEFTIITHKSGSVTTYEFTPTTGNIVCQGRFNLQSETAKASAKLSISSGVSLWDYNVKLNADPTHILKDSVFINQDSPASEQFVFTVAKDHSTEGTWTPMQGTDQITLDNVPAYTRHGQDGEVVITSWVNTQKNEDRCYIDFYKKEELGAEPVLEFRANVIEYGSVDIGTPASPKPWEVGDPDIEYGTINDATTDFIEYGTITEKVEGEWAEWWKWDREKEWYPTNHVDLEMKLPPGVNFSEYIDTFIEQFYNLASTVVFIHQITESFYFGNDTTTNYNSLINGKDGITGDPGVMAAPFGIVSTMPTMEYESTVTSDPSRQYIDPIADEFPVTIIPTIPNASVSVIIENVDSTGEIVQTIIPLTAADDWTTQVKYGTTITYKVEATGYITRSTVIKVDKQIIKHVTLEAETPTEPKYCRLTLNTLPLNAEVTFTVNNITTTNSHTIYAWEGNTVKYSVAYPNHITQCGTVTLTDDTDIDITLENGVLFTVKTSPVDANVCFNVSGGSCSVKKKIYLNNANVVEIDKQTYVPIDRGFSYTVSKSGYISKTFTRSVTEPTTVYVELQKISE